MGSLGSSRLAVVGVGGRSGLRPMPQLLGSTIGCRAISGRAVLGILRLTATETHLRLRNGLARDLGVERAVGSCVLVRLASW